MREVVIASYVRTAQSRCRPNDPSRDWLFKLRADELLARLLPEVIRRARIEPADVDDLIVGCAQAVGENFSIGGRSPLLLANLDKRTSSKLIDEQFPPGEWNIYPFHFSDGDNWSGKDTERCVELLRDRIIPRVNQFCYGQVKSAYGTGQFKGDLDDALGAEDKVVTSDIPNRDAILESIRTFLGKGR